jgi:hypothetical protein
MRIQSPVNICKIWHSVVLGNSINLFTLRSTFCIRISACAATKQRPSTKMVLMSLFMLLDRFNRQPTATPNKHAVNCPISDGALRCPYLTYNLPHSCPFGRVQACLTGNCDACKRGPELVTPCVRCGCARVSGTTAGLWEVMIGDGEVVQSDESS